jgi:hypothetical protein
VSLGKAKVIGLLANNMRPQEIPTGTPAQIIAAILQYHTLKIQTQSTNLNQVYKVTVIIVVCSVIGGFIFIVGFLILCCCP